MNYKKSVEEIYRELNTSINGLTQEEAIIRLDKYGENKLKEGKKKSAFVMFLSQFNDFMIILLIFASIISYSSFLSIEAVNLSTVRKLT